MFFATAWRSLVSHTFVFVYMQEFGYIITKEITVKLLKDK